MSKPQKPDRPNIMLVISDQYRFPRFSYGPDAGFAQPLKDILGFQGEVGAGNPYAVFFPGLLRLRKNAVVLRNHTIAASACTPSRSTVFTGQYGTRTGVTQTDGLFKSGDAPSFPWLKADGIPTLGHWMRQAGYSTHYFGKWHLSNPPGHSLQRFGFSDWEWSYPEPHGQAVNNLGVYRDGGFADNACCFLRRKGLALNYDYATASEENRTIPAGTTAVDETGRPWFAVVSFANPHDIATYPALISQVLPSDAAPATLPGGRTLPVPKTQSAFGPLTVPKQGDRTPPPTNGTMCIPLNPLGFPQDCARPPLTQNEPLTDKPSCQFDAAYKIGLALAARAGYGALSGLDGDHLKAAVALALRFSIPFQLADDPDQACLQFLQFYGYMTSLVDPHIDRVLQTLEESGQADNTIVIFMADHGELGAAHGMMMEKWHVAYQEALHVPVVVQLPKDAGGDGSLRQIDALTSHIDILPTILGLAGVGPRQREEIARDLARQYPVPPLPGLDLAPLLRGETDVVTDPDGKPRLGVLFITDDEITEPPAVGRVTQPELFEAFHVFEATVDAVRHGTPNKAAVPKLAPGAVRQPNHIRCVRTQDAKLARYFDPSGQMAQEWELYDLTRDPNETQNLVQVGVTPPTARPDLPSWTTTAQVQEMADRLAILLAELERRDL